MWSLLDTLRRETAARIDAVTTELRDLAKGLKPGNGSYTAERLRQLAKQLEELR